MRHSAFIPLTAFLLVAGCINAPIAKPETTTFDIDAEWALRAVASDPDHLHNLTDHHRNLSTPNFELLGWSPVLRDGSSTMGAGGCGAVNAGDERKLAVFTSSWNNANGLAVADVSDPQNPRTLSTLVSDAYWFRDAEITPDGRWAVVASFSAMDDLPVQTTTKSTRLLQACGEDMVPPAAMNLLSGVALIDLADPSRPRIVDFAPDPVGGPHSVFATTIDGTHYVMAAHNGIPSDLSRFWFYTIRDGQLVPYGLHAFQTPRAQPQQPLFNLHTDSWIHKHPKTGQIFAYLANWNSGLVVLRLDGPGRITQVGYWNDYDPSKGNGMTGQIHSVEPANDLWDGKHYTFIGQELISRPANRPSGQVVMLDTTDPTQPRAVARWTLPADTGFWNNEIMWCCLFSTHYLELVDKVLFIAMYHGGVWAIDVRPGQGPELASLGVFIPTPPHDEHASPNPSGPAPLIMEVYKGAGDALTTFDEAGGLYTFRFRPEVPVPVPTPWTKDSWLR